LRRAADRKRHLSRSGDGGLVQNWGLACWEERKKKGKGKGERREKGRGSGARRLTAMSLPISQRGEEKGEKKGERETPDAAGRRPGCRLPACSSGGGASRRTHAAWRANKRKKRGGRRESRQIRLSLLRASRRAFACGRSELYPAPIAGGERKEEKKKREGGGEKIGTAGTDAVAPRDTIDLRVLRGFFAREKGGKRGEEGGAKWRRSRCCSGPAARLRSSDVSPLRVLGHSRVDVPRKRGEKKGGEEEMKKSWRRSCACFLKPVELGCAVITAQKKEKGRGERGRRADAVIVFGVSGTTTRLASSDARRGKEKERKKGMDDAGEPVSLSGTIAIARCWSWKEKEGQRGLADARPPHAGPAVRA